jgi:tRNA pseudouridine55 synthase
MNLSGVLIVDKPCGVTSHDVILKLRRMLHMASIGHAGTLDPGASGLLLACVGRATKIVQFLSRYDKEYEAVIQLGLATDTYDGEGRVTAKHSGELPQPDQIERVLLGLKGKMLQTPPPFSAVKHKGRKLYQYARAQEKVEVNPKEIEIKDLQVLEISPPRVKFTVGCSKGTYIRSLASEIGERLGCGAHLSELRRTGVGPFRLEHALSLEELEATWRRGDISAVMEPIEATLSHFPRVTVKREFCGRVKHGAALHPSWVKSVEGRFDNGDTVSIRDQDDQILALGRALASSKEFSNENHPGEVFQYTRVI